MCVLKCSKTIFRHRASPRSHIGGVAPDPLFSVYSIKCLRYATANSCEYLVLVTQEKITSHNDIESVLGRVVQSVTCLATDACLTADPGVASSIPALSHSFLEIDHEIISKVILLPSADSFKKGCCQLQAKVCA